MLGIAMVFIWFYARVCSRMSFTVYLWALLIVAPSIVSAKYFNPICSGIGASCLDCHTQKFCLGSIVLSNASCPGGGFCDPRDGQCKSQPFAQCEAEANFKCLRQNGVFPKLYNCNQYTRCKNNVSEDISCQPRHVYSPMLGKCVVQLENSDCYQPKCGFANSVHMYELDPSLYYECNGGNPTLQACPENTVYDVGTKTCTSICTLMGNGLVANMKNCSEYFICEQSNPVPLKKTCPPGSGFNRVTGKCQEDLAQLCFEIAVFHRELGNALNLPEFVRNIIRFVTQLLGRFNISYTTLLKLGVPAQLISDVLLIGDYILLHGLRPPPLLLGYIVELLLPLVPPNMRGIVDMILSVIFGNLKQ